MKKIVKKIMLGMLFFLISLIGISQVLAVGENTTKLEVGIEFVEFSDDSSTLPETSDSDNGSNFESSSKTDIHTKPIQKEKLPQTGEKNSVTYMIFGSLIILFVCEKKLKILERGEE